MKKTFLIGMAIVLCVFSFLLMASNTNRIAANDEPGPHGNRVIITIKA